MFGGLADVIGAFAPEREYKTLRNTKNSALESLIQGLTSDYSTGKAKNAGDIEEFSQLFSSLAPQRQERTASDIGALDRYYNGDMARVLAGLRAQRGKALSDALNVDKLTALGQIKANSLIRPGGDGSYNRAITTKAIAPLMARYAVSDADAARGDLGFLEQMRVGNLGKRNALADAGAMASLVPMGVRNAESSRLGSSLAQLLGLDQANNFYGLAPVKTGWDTAIGVLNGLQKSLGEDIQIGSSVMGMMGGMGGMGGALPKGSVDFMGSAPSTFTGGGSGLAGGPYTLGGYSFGSSPSPSTFNYSMFQ